MDKLTNFVSFFAALALATERITETIKGLPILSNWLAVKRDSSSLEEFRKASIHIIAMAVATALVYFTRDQISSLTGMHYEGIWTYLLFGAMASGGSGMWNSVLDILNEANHQKQLVTQVMMSNPAAVVTSLPGPTVTPSTSTVPGINQNQSVAVKPPQSGSAQPTPSAPPSVSTPQQPSAPAATGERLLQLARQHLGEKYVLSVNVPKNDPNWEGAWNCSEFASWLVYQVAGILYGCDDDTADPAIAHAYTGYWNRDAQTRGQIISIEQAARTPGAAVLRLPQPGATGHIVISDGRSGTIEARSPVDGVVPFTLNGRRWDLAILVPGITYSEGVAVTVSPPTTAIYRLTEPMMMGDKVVQIQEALKAAGFDPGKPDGEFGPRTQAAVVAFQTSHSLVADGEVGPQTAAALGVQLT